MYDEDGPKKDIYNERDLPQGGGFPTKRGGGELLHGTPGESD